MRSAPLPFFPLLFLILLFLSSAAWAVTPEERAGARAAAQRGVEAYNDGEYRKAIDFLERAEKLVHAPTHLLYSARAHVELGQLVVARELYLKVKREELAASAPEAFHAAKRDAEQELDKLEPRIPYVSVVVQGAGQEPVKVFRNDKEMPSPLVGIPQPMDPGEHSFRATAPGKESSTQSVLVKEGSEETILLTLRGGMDTSAGSSDGVSDASKKGGWTGLKIAGLSSLGLGAVGAGVGTVFLLRASDLQKQADDAFAACPSEGCSSEREERILVVDDEAATNRGVAIASYGVGGAALIAGVVLLIIDGQKKSREQAVLVRPHLGWSTVGLSGRF